MIIIGNMQVDTSKVPEISNFKFDDLAVREYIRSKIKNCEMPTLDGLDLAKASGLYYWAAYNCPNKHVVHLMKYSKSRRIRYKNYNRAMIFIGKILQRKGATIVT